MAKLLAASGARSVANTLRPYDDAVNELDLAVFQASVLYGVGTTKELRDKAQALTQTANAALTALNLNQAVYQALAALPAPDDAATRHYLERTLLEYRLAGVDKDEATRKKIVALQDKVTEYGLAFERAVHEDLHTMLVPKAELAGMPADYLAAHPADAQGQVKITSDYPDVRPVRRFADSTDLRHKAYLLYAQRGYPGNTDTLRKLLATREELAHVLGYRTWADFAMADQMMGSPAKLAEFLKQIDSASREPSEREDRALVAFAHGRDASITKLSVADQALLDRAVPARQVRLRLAERAPVLPLRAGRARRHRHRLEAVPRRTSARWPACAPGTPRSPSTTSTTAAGASAASTWTCTRATARTSGSPPRR